MTTPRRANRCDHQTYRYSLLKAQRNTQNVIHHVALPVFFFFFFFTFIHVCDLCASGRPMVVSTGMQSMETIRRVYNTVKAHNQNFTMLQCTSAYPLDPKDVNLKVIKV